jgi:UPF0716 protein FxsA
MLRLLLLFTLLPAIELALLIEVGRRIGTLPTLGLILLTGVIGATLARYQGIAVLRRMQEELADGRLPAGSLLDGVIILIAAALLVTPGILTDAVGFALLIPMTRVGIRELMRRWFERALREGRANVVISFGPPRDRPRGGP